MPNMIYKVEIQARKWFNKIKGLGVEIELNLTNVTYQLLASQLQPEKKPDRKFQGFFFFFFLFPTQQTECQTKMCLCRLLIKVNDAV